MFLFYVFFKILMFILDFTKSEILKHFLAGNFISSRFHFLSLNFLKKWPIVINNNVIVTFSQFKDLQTIFYINTFKK